MIETEKLRSIPMEKVATALGFQINRGAARCRLPGHEDKNPSFSVRSQTNRFHCYACNRGGDTIELVRVMHGVDFVTACRWLSEQFGVYAFSPERYRPARVINSPGHRVELKKGGGGESEDARLPDEEVFNFVLGRSPLTGNGREYLLSRNFTESTIQTFKIGQIGDCRALQTELVAVFGTERIARCGLLQDGRYGPYFAIKSGYLLFPFVTEGRVVYLQGRRLGDGDGPRWLCPAGLRPPVFNLDVLSERVTSILVCEGVTDVLSAHELEINSIGLVGASARLDAETVMRLRGRNVAVLGDADLAGESFARRTVNQLSALGITATTKSLPLGSNDLNDYLCRKRGGKL